MSRSGALRQGDASKGTQMTQHFHAVVCIDHAEAVILDFSKDEFNETHISATHRHGHIHHKSGPPGSGHEQDSKAYFEAVAAQAGLSQEVLIIGHGDAKTQFAHFVRDHVPALAPRIKGVEAVDHPSNGEILALARKFFDGKDLTTPQIS
jgi:stalled ribosome rescue protein Dom34